jgi:outer membrane receptor for ferrienterochelin and colicins
LVMGVAVIGINNTIPNQPSTDDFFFTREARINANYVFAKANLTASLFYKFNGKVRNFTYDVVSGQIINGFIDSYSLMDATLSKQLFNKSLTVTAGSKNLLNVVNIAANLVTGVHSTGSNSANIAMGRTYFISCAYTLTYSKKNG